MWHCKYGGGETLKVEEYNFKGDKSVRIILEFQGYGDFIILDNKQAKGIIDKLNEIFKK